MKERDTTAVIGQIAKKHGVGQEAVATALAALRRGNGTMAQFSHADFGGMAQWSRGGMSMVGDMFNSSLKAKLDGVLADLVDALRDGTVGQDERQPGTLDKAATRRGGFEGGSWWPSEFGSPSSSGSQNDMRYAFFPSARRLIVEDGVSRKVYDTAQHMISGVSQQQSTDRDLKFESQFGAVRLNELRVVE